MGETSWAFLLIGSFAAVGAAMAVGTLAALWNYHRTGTMPGSDGREDIAPTRIASLWIRVGVGLLLTAIGVVALERAGIW